MLEPSQALPQSQPQGSLDLRRIIRGDESDELSKPSREAIRDILRALTDREPPNSLAEWRDEALRSLGYVPSYGRERLDEAGSARDN